MLRACIDAVLAQEYESFELVVSDNANEDETPDLLREYASHPRVRILRQRHPLEVADNWNAAFAASRGKRILLIGDDDLLLPNYFQRADELLARHGEPDVLVHNGYTFAYPGLANSHVSHYQESFFESSNISAAGELSRAERRRLVQRLFRFDACMTCNMQVTNIARQALERLPRAPFKPPWPDFYCGVGMLLTAERWVIVHDRLVVVGVSPKSFGRLAFSAEGGKVGRDYLGVDLGFAGQLPGSAIIDGHYKTLLVMKQDFADELRGVEPDYHEYVLQQVYSWYYQRRLGLLSTRELFKHLRLLRTADALGLPRVAAKRVRPDRVKRLLALRRGTAAQTLWPGMQPLPEISGIGEFAQWVMAGQPPSWPAAHHHPAPL